MFPKRDVSEEKLLKKLRLHLERRTVKCWKPAPNLKLRLNSKILRTTEESNILENTKMWHGQKEEGENLHCLLS